MLTEILENITGAFTQLMSSMIGAVKTGVSDLLFQEGASGERVLSDFAQFGLVFVGIGLAIGLVWFVIGLIRR